MDIGIIGGGIAGIASAYYLAEQGHRVTLFEKEDFLGGLASSFLLDGAYIERYWHFICLSDHELLGLCRELGINDKLRWSPTKMTYLHNGRIYAFGTPKDLLSFKPVSFLGRVRFGINVVYARGLKYWQKLDHISAKEWFIKHIGKNAYQVIWDPLLKFKFGEDYDKISASWIWHRIHRVARSRKNMLQREFLGYLEGGTKTLLDALTEELSHRGCTLLRNTAVQQIRLHDGHATGLVAAGRGYEFDIIISAVPLPVFTRLLPEGAEEYRTKLERISFIGVVSMILKLRQPLTDSFWVNVSDPGIAFNGIIEYTNLNPCEYYNGSRIAYIPFYLPTSADRFQYSDKELFEEYVSVLPKLNPHFDQDWVEQYHVFRDRYAQAICTRGFAELVPPHKTPYERLYLIDSTQLYPSDRTISGMVGLAKRVSEEVAANSSGHFEESGR